MDNLLTLDLEAHNPEKNHHRHYQATVGRDLLDDWTVTIRYGRTGQTGREARYAAAKPEAMQAVIRERLRRRLTAPKRIGCPYRLARNVHFLSGLMEAGVEFVCCDMPSANRLTLHIMAAVAEDEAKRISERTKAALAAYKARGGILGAARPGAYRLTGGANPKAARRAGEAARAMAEDAYADLKPWLVEMRETGLSLRQIAGRLDAEGHTTRQGKSWNPVQVGRVLDYRLK